MKLSDFDYQLPKELIAQYPLRQRDASRLLVLERRTSSIKHSVFKNIGDYLETQDLLVLNRTKVLPARLEGRRLTGGKVEVLLLKHKGELKFNALIRPSRLKAGEKIIFNGAKFYGLISCRNEITFSGVNNLKRIYQQGQMPLPPYIKRKSENLDSTYYQTVYAKENGSIAAPTAGLHFTKRLIRRISSLGVKTAYLTLHISYSTFRPVKCVDITRHKMDKEYFDIPQKTWDLVRQSRLNKGRVFAVGTTSLRALEAAYSGRHSGYTDLFIYPGYKFKAVDCLLTNFHLPRTSLFMLASAFAGKDLIKKAYQEAIDKRYRFYSYGDAMLII